MRKSYSLFLNYSIDKLKKMFNMNMSAKKLSNQLSLQLPTQRIAFQHTLSKYISLLSDKSRYFLLHLN